MCASNTPTLEINRSSQFEKPWSPSILAWNSEENYPKFFVLVNGLLDLSISPPPGGGRNAADTGRFFPLPDLILQGSITAVLVYTNLLFPPTVGIVWNRLTEADKAIFLIYFFDKNISGTGSPHVCDLHLHLRPRRRHWSCFRHVNWRSTLTHLSILSRHVFIFDSRLFFFEGKPPILSLSAVKRCSWNKRLAPFPMTQNETRRGGAISHSNPLGEIFLPSNICSVGLQLIDGTPHKKKNLNKSVSGKFSSCAQWKR